VHLVAKPLSYTHYYTIHGWNTLDWQLVWSQLLEDVRLILEASDVLLSGLSNEETTITPPIVDKDEGIIFNGFADDCHETFVLSAKCPSGFVKTNRKPYDLAVACVLLRVSLVGQGCADVR
jgi:hypothetical protein